jgi:hypothetical protein
VLYGTTPYSQLGGGAVFRLVQPPVLNAKPPDEKKVALLWNSFPGGTYRVEFQQTLTGTNWTTLNPAVTAAGSTASVTDNPGGASERYYRIRLLP